MKKVIFKQEYVFEYDSSYTSYATFIDALIRTRTTSDIVGDPIVESVRNTTKEKFIKDLKQFIEYNHGKN